VTLPEATERVSGFASWKHVDKIRFFCWYLHAYRGLAEIKPRDVNACYDELHLEPPGSVGPFFKLLVGRRPRELLKNAAGYRLEQRVRTEFDAKYGRREATVRVDALLAGLLPRVADAEQRAFLDEALICFRHGAFRASIVMTWNLAYDHLCNFVVASNLSAFNVQLPKSFPKADVLAVVRREDLSALRENQVLQVCKSAGIIMNPLFKNLSARLDRRNACAHPTGVAISRLTAEEYIGDLVENVLLKL
jgi:hypothetical protein